MALSTLRNDVEGAESPLDVYVPNSPWPAVDPDRDDSKNRPTASKHGGLQYTWWQRLKYFVGAGRSDRERTRYNAARPLGVLGGVSEGEIRLLQMARGPGAKTQLCWYWLSEYIAREHLEGSLGKVGPPIVSRIFQFLGDGMIFYNHARKIMQIPFPFPHAQLSAVFLMVAVPAIAVLMDQYAENLWAACILAFLTVTCLSGIHEVARELENPFRNVPNESKWLLACNLFVLGGIDPLVVRQSRIDFVLTQVSFLLFSFATILSSAGDDTGAVQRNPSDHVCRLPPRPLLGGRGRTVSEAARRPQGDTAQRGRSGGGNGQRRVVTSSCRCCSGSEQRRQQQHHHGPRAAPANARAETRL